METEPQLGKGQLGHKALPHSSVGLPCPLLSLTSPPFFVSSTDGTRGHCSNKGLLKSWRKQRELEQSIIEVDQLRSKCSLTHRLLTVVGRNGAGHSRTNRLAISKPGTYTVCLKGPLLKAFISGVRVHTKPPGCGSFGTEISSL